MWLLAVIEIKRRKHEICYQTIDFNECAHVLLHFISSFASKWQTYTSTHNRFENK